MYVFGCMNALTHRMYKPVGIYLPIPNFSTVKAFTVALCGWQHEHVKSCYAVLLQPHGENL